MKKVYVVKNRYVDSVTLMGVADSVLAKASLHGAESGMGTDANIELLTSMGYQVPPDTGKTDLMLALDGDSEEQLEHAHQIGVDVLNRGAQQGRMYYDLDAVPSGAFDLAQISLPGVYACAEIKKALQKGMDVFVFSDNVSLEEERECKLMGQRLGRLVMGPDAGVGLIGGVALAAGSIVRQGSVGIVAASGSGAQEVACLIERLGDGVSTIIGTGGHDLHPQVGGITMRMGMERLEKDENTRVICLLSKLADGQVMADMLREADGLTKPVVALFLGADPSLFSGHKALAAFSLEEAALLCYERATGEKKTLGWNPAQTPALVEQRMKTLAPQRKYFRGLYCGGTFTEEAMILFSQVNPGVRLHSNLRTRYAQQLPSHHRSIGHSALDLGAEDFTAEAPHPVFDPQLRLSRLQEELTDPEVAVILLDFITGPGVHQNPILPFVPVIAAHPEVVFIATICGAQGDPQDIAGAREALTQAGAIVADSNHQSARLAAAWMAALQGRA